jgi:predicted nucleotidyltransferase
VTLTPTDFRGLLRCLLEAHVEFVLVGGVAGIVHGSARATFDIDLFGEVTGGGTYEKLLPATIAVDLSGFRCRCVTLEQLIQLKRAAGRPKDFEAIAELEAIAEERQRSHEG